MEDKTIELKTRIDGVIVYQTGVQIILGGIINLAKGDQLDKLGSNFLLGNILGIKWVIIILYLII